MPSRAGYFVAVLILVAGLVGAGMLLWSQLQGLGDALQRVVVPGEAELALSETGTYTIFHEPAGTIDGEVYSAGNISGLRVALAAADTGEAVPLQNVTVSSRYSFGGHTGFGVFNFEIAKPGPYRLTAGYEDGRAEPRTVLAVSQGFVGKLLGVIFATLGVAFAALGIAAAIAIVTFRRRRKYRTSAAAGTGAA